MKADPGAADVPGFFLIMNKQIFNHIAIADTAIIFGGAPLAALILLLIQLINLLLIIDPGGRWRW